MNELELLMMGQLCLAFFYGVSAKYKKKRLPYGKIAMTAFIPAVGIVLPYIAESRKRKRQVAFEDLFKTEEYVFVGDVRYFKSADVEREVNAVPVEEALLLNDGSVKRQLIVETTKEDAYDYISFLKLAMRDSDIETSHYAASIIMEVNRKLQNLIQEQSVRYEQHPDDPDAHLNYLRTVQRYYHSQLLDERTQLRYQYLLDQLLERWIDAGHEEEAWFEEKLDLVFKTKEYGRFKHWVDRYHQAFPESERPYLLLLKYYFEVKDTERFQATVEGIRRNKISLSREGLGILRFWTGGEGS